MLVMPPKLKKKTKQLELGIRREVEPDRNLAKGGRSFYFFDFDDNVANLSTSIFIYHKDSGAEVCLSSREFAEHSAHIGKRGPYKDFRIDYDDQKGTFRCFRDKDLGLVRRWLGGRQTFVRDLAHALGLEEFHWQGPSWSCFKHAVFNRRPISLITARGHHPETLKEGIQLMVREGHLPHEPNYLSLFPVSHPRIKSQLGLALNTPIAQLKQAAIRASVQEAFRTYGFSPHHRFGMSDDDPENVRLIVEEMVRLKAEYPANSFFVIETHRGQFVKREVFPRYTVDQILLPVGEQLSLFEK
jgi:hypothetical protein